jgi:hypothetical protein
MDVGMMGILNPPSSTRSKICRIVRSARAVAASSDRVLRRLREPMHYADVGAEGQGRADLARQGRFYAVSFADADVSEEEGAAE